MLHFLRFFFVEKTRKAKKKNGAASQHGPVSTETQCAFGAERDLPLTAIIEKRIEECIEGEEATNEKVGREVATESTRKKMFAPSTRTSGFCGVNATK